MTFFDRLPYIMATYIYKEGIECDHAARLIRIGLQQYFENIKAVVRQEMGEKYTQEKERR